MLNVMEEGKKLMYGLLYVSLLIFVIRFFSLGKWEVIGVLSLSNLVLMSYTAFKFGTPFSFSKLAKNIIQIIVIVHILRFIGSYGWIGWVSSILLIVAYILFKNWKKYIEVKQHIESMLFGKPLNEYVKEGKKPPKIEVVWSKK